ncbi:MAG: EF-P lysine aminoacylase GenX [Cryobacterium sp.]|nr:EF-P lysine aminoacylase GenX [Oligoflexia bacterium]
MKKGRITALSHNPDQSLRVQLRNLRGEWEFNLTPSEQNNAEPLQIGDIVDPGPPLKKLTRSLRPGETSWMQKILDPRRLHAMRVRNHVETGIRDFFTARDFMETRTPLLVPCPGMETHIRTFRTESGAYLPTSPEFAMKRLLVGGLEKIFQICPAYRYEPLSTTHHPEFTMLEWYRAYDSLASIQADTESLIETLAISLNGKPEIQFGTETISVKTPWPRLRVRDLYESLAIDLVDASTPEKLGVHCTRLGIAFNPTDSWDDLYFRIWLNLIEPKLPADRAIFIERYPPSQAALAVLDADPDGSVWALRSEFYIAGLELGNAFEELTDAREQRARFTRDMQARTEIYGDDFPPAPLDEEFLGALEEGLPPSGGIAVGVDRLVMLFANEPELEKTLWLKSYAGTVDPDPPLY